MITVKTVPAQNAEQLPPGINSVKMTIELQNGCYQVNLAFPWQIGIALNFNHNQPNHFGAEKATAEPMRAGGFVGDTTQGGSCNVNELRFNPHCNGTHTETLAHICDSDHPLSVKIHELDLPPLLPCALVTVKPEEGLASADSYQPDLLPGDHIVSRQALEKGLGQFDDCQVQAVVIRTLPNEIDKCQRAYNQDNQPPFLSRDAVLYLNERGVEHLILDVPSVDRLFDDGLMTCHHLFWQVPEGSHQGGPQTQVNKTITEMAYIPNELEDGFYFLNLQTPAFVNDAAPSRPVLYSAELRSALTEKNQTL